ncbi:hypothetical protein QOT17_011211 [Balamuthia mandrillaris]
MRSKHRGGATHVTSSQLFRLDVNFTEKLPHGPYLEQGQGPTHFVLYVLPTATVGDVHSVFYRFFDETIQRQQEGMPRVAKVKVKMRILETKCKGGAVTEGEKLQDLLESGEALSLTVRQTAAVGCWQNNSRSFLVFEIPSEREDESDSVRKFHSHSIEF